VRQKFIKLFEEFSKEMTNDKSETAHTWAEIRDVIQMKRPFAIIVFKTKESYLSALESSLKEYDVIKQDAVFMINGKSIVYPSVFFALDRDSDFSNQVLELYENFEIRQVIAGRAGSEYSTLYSEDGTASDFGNEIVSTLNPNEFSSEDHFVLGSTCYRFIAFID